MSKGGLWVPLESNPEVFNSWAKQAGLVLSQACFHDVLGLDDEILSLVPQPVKALILIFPNIGEIAAKHDAEDEKIKSEGAFPVDPTVLWFRQTIGNACGSMAILHSLANSDVTLAPHGPLAKIIEECKDKTPEERVHFLETSPLFTSIHTDSANQGQSIVTEDIMNTPLHYSAFVMAPEPDLRKKASEGGGAGHPDDSVGNKSTGMRLVELDGDRVGPLDRGECNNFLLDAVRYIKENYIATASTDVRFTIIALGSPG